MLKLYQFSPRWNIPNTSPFCLKLETYLRMAQIPYTNKYVNDPRKSPKGKLPYILDDGKKIADSNLIIDYLQQKYPEHPDKHLSKSQLAMSVAMLRLLEEHLYWTFMYARWGDNQSWEIVKDDFFGKVPLPAKWILPNYYRKKVLNQIYETGISHHTAEEIYDFGKRDIDAVATLFSQDDYFFGPRPSSLDAAIFGIFCNIIYAPLPSPLSRHTERYPQLKTYCDRILETYYQKIE